MPAKGTSKKDRIVDGVLVRTCTKCHVEKPLELFPRQKEAINGRHIHCLECRSRHKRERSVVSRRLGRGLNDYRVDGDCAYLRIESVHGNIEALVSASDIPRLIEFNKRWQLDSNGYISSGGRKNYKSWRVSMHRFLLECEPGQEVDHINGIRHDNRRCNLRIVTHSQNVHNSIRTGELSRGVYRRGTSYAAELWVDGERVFYERGNDPAKLADALAQKRIEHGLAEFTRDS